MALRAGNSDESRGPAGGPDSYIPGCGAAIGNPLSRGGVTTYLEALDSERNVYSAELTLA